MFILGSLESSCRLPISDNEHFSLIFTTEMVREKIAWEVRHDGKIRMRNKLNKTKLK